MPVDQELTERGSTTHARISFESDPNAVSLCSGCLRPASSIHRYRVRTVRDLNLAHAVVELLIPHRMVRCAQCGIRAEAHDFLDPFRRTTARFEQAVADLCRVLPIKQVAEHFKLSWHAVKEIDKRRLQREVGTPNYEGLRLLAVDEVAIHKGHTYLTTVLDLETGRIVWAGHGRSEATLMSFFNELSPEQRDNIETVASDMASGFRNAVQRACPQAALVYDLFHVVAKYAREVVDVVRTAEAKKQREAGRKLIKGSRYLLLKNASNLGDNQRATLRDLLAANENLNTL